MSERPSGLAAVYGGSAPHHRSLTAAKYRRHLRDLVYLPDLAATDLTVYRTVLIPDRLHHGLLERSARRILDFLAGGGTVVAMSGGEPFPVFLPGIAFEHRPTNFWWWTEPDPDLGLVAPAPGHPLFTHITLPDATWHYHGVLTPPPGAETLVALRTGEAILYIDEASTPGRLVIATLDPLFHYGNHFMPATERFLDGFLPWLETL